MQAGIKVIVGILLVVGSVWWIYSGATQYVGNNQWLNGVMSRHRGISDLVTVLDGMIPILVFLLGIFIIWLEIDEMKIEKEIRKRK